MRAKDYLYRIREIDENVEDLMDQIARLKNVAEGLSGRVEGEKVQSSGPKDGMEKAIVRYISLEEKLTSDMVLELEERAEIIQILNILSRDEHQVLRLIYVSGLDYYSVSDVTQRSYNWVKKKHATGIKKVQAELDRREAE